MSRFMSYLYESEENKRALGLEICASGRAHAQITNVRCDDTMQLPHGRNNWKRFVYIYKLFLVVGVNRAGG